jgi:DNA-binding CsgD family transcriptional regulator/DNA-binding transcriptional regulator YdaS (Cro superfamily)
MLLEREPELARIDTALASWREGLGGVVLVEGPPGIGKTRLLAAASERAATDGVLRLSARGGELERDFAFGLARQLFEPALLELHGDARAEVLAGAAALASPVVGFGDDAALTGDRRFAVTHGLYWLCANLAARTPLVLEVDDVQWADEPSVRWLAYLTRRLSDLPVIVLLTARIGDRGPAADGLDAIAGEPVTALVAPRPLSVRAAAEVIAAVTGSPPADSVASAVHERSAGNPFVLRELAAAISHAGLEAGDDDAAADIAGVLPPTVARTVSARLNRLGEHATALARAVAVLGSSDVQLVDAARLAELAERTAADALDELVAAGLLLNGSPLRFAHPLMREAIYDEIPTGRRLYEHRRAAEVLQARLTPERIAVHLLMCEPQGDAESVAVLRQCGERALRRGAPHAAARYLRRALDEGPPEEMRVGVLRELGVAEGRLGDADAIGHLEEAFELARTPLDLTTAASELAIALGAHGRMAEAVAALEHGVDALSDRDRELRLRLEGELGAIGQLALAATPRVSERLRTVAPGLAGDTPGERLVLASFAHLRSNELAPAAELSELASRALSDGLLLTEQTADSAVFYLLMYVFYRAERGDVAEHWLGVALEEARARGSMLGMSIALAVRSQLRWLRGDLENAAADAQTALDAQSESGWGGAQPLAVAVRAECLLEQGETARALALYSESGLDGVLPELQMFRWAQATRGRVRLAAGHYEQGIADLLDCRRQDMGRRADIALAWRTDVALALAVKEPERATQLAAEHVALARAGGDERAIGMGLRTRALLSPGDEAQALLAEAVAVLEGSAAHLEHARALVDLGGVVRRNGQRGDAREHLRAGYELARQCGSALLAERARTELAASGVRMRRAALTGRDALTPSERRVAEMAAKGMSNPEIAQALFVTRKTVEMHLGHVYRKLEVNGREELPVHLEPVPA